MKKSFRVLKRRVIFAKGPIYLVDCDVKVPGEMVISRQILEHPGSVVMIPRMKRNSYCLVRQFRFAAKDWLWEFPAGGIEPGESFRQGAIRELIEEIGYRPRRLKKLTEFYPSPGISGEVMHLFLAENFVPAYAKPDADEQIEKREFSSAQILKMIRSGAIIDAKTVAGFLYLQKSGL